jgi:hypothetical protein
MASFPEPLDDSDLPIEPRPEPEPEPQPLPDSQLPNPEPASHSTVVIPAPTPRTIASRGFSECDGATEADRLLQSIVLLARKETPNKGALRSMIARFSNEHGLGF